MRKDRNRADRREDDAGPVRTFGELVDSNVAPAIQRLVGELGTAVPLTAMPHNVAVRPMGSARVAAHVKPQTLTLSLAPVDAEGLADEVPDVRVEPTSASTHHVHVPAAALDDGQGRRAARTALELALARVAGGQ